MPRQLDAARPAGGEAMTDYTKLTDAEVREAVDFFSNPSNFDGRNIAECEISCYGKNLLSHLAAVKAELDAALALIRA